MAVTGMAGYAGMTPQLEPTPPKTVQSFSVNLNNQVCIRLLLLSPRNLLKIIFVTTIFYYLLSVIESCWFSERLVEEVF